MKTHKEVLKCSSQAVMNLIEIFEDAEIEQLPKEDAVQSGEYDDGD